MALVMRPRAREDLVNRAPIKGNLDMPGANQGESWYAMSVIKGNLEFRLMPRQKFSKIFMSKN
jgi:hypothetical protein